MSRKDGSMKKWNPNGGFPTAEQLERMVAAEVKHLAEVALQRQQGFIFLRMQPWSLRISRRMRRLYLL